MRFLICTTARLGLGQWRVDYCASACYNKGAIPMGKYGGHSSIGGAPGCGPGGYGFESRWSPMKIATTSRSFILKPSTVANGGVGVFALHDIAAGAYLELFLQDFQEELLDADDVPVPLQAYCLTQQDGKLLCPKFFNRLDIGNYLNHSDTPNLTYEKGKGYSASRDIREGEELFADYRQLGEPAEARESYYV